MGKEDAQKPFSLNTHASIQKHFEEKITTLNENSKNSLHHWGLKTPNDVYQFLLSTEGKKETAHAYAELANEESLNEHKALELQEKLARRYRLSALLSLYLLQKKSHAAKQLSAFLEEQDEQASRLKEIQKEPSASEKTLKMSQEKHLHAALVDYDKAILAYQEQYLNLSQETQHLQERLQFLHVQHENTMDKYLVYQNSLNTFDNELKESLDVNQKISALEAQLHEQTTTIMTLLESGKDSEARHLLHQQNALNLQIATLYDLKAQQQGDKCFFDEDGEEVQSPLNAAFVLPMEKRIVHDHGKYYLLNQNAVFSELSLADKELAHQAFNKDKQALLSVKKVVSQTKQSEQQFQDQQIEDVESQLTKTQAQMQLTYQFTKALHKNRDEVSKKMQDLLPAPSPSVANFMQRKEMLFKPGLNCKTLFAEVACQNSPKDAKEIKNYLDKFLAAQGLGATPSWAPLPQNIINSLLKHMARFGILPYKDSVTTLEPPTNSLSHGPFSKTPTPKLF